MILIFSQKIAENLAFFQNRNCYSFLQKLNHNIGFLRKTPIFSPKIAKDCDHTYMYVTLTPGQIADSARISRLQFFTFCRGKGTRDPINLLSTAVHTYIPTYIRHNFKPFSFIVSLPVRNYDFLNCHRQEWWETDLILTYFPIMAYQIEQDLPNYWERKGCSFLLKQK
jgi:hypothetical protein